MYKTSEEYTRLGHQVMEEVPELKHLLEDDVRITFRASNRKKGSSGKATLGECIKVKDLYSEYCPWDFFIVIYEPNCEGMTEKQMKILLEHELLHVGLEKKKDGEVRYYVVPHDYDDFRSITRKYGPDWSITEQGHD